MSQYFNRELSWLEFNARVLAEAENLAVPLLERVKFLSIFSSNLDEFFMVRVAGLWRMVQEQFPVMDSPDDLTSEQALNLVRRRVEELHDRCHTLADQLLAELHQQGIQVISMEQCSKEQKAYLDEFFETQVAPVLTPLSVDPAHPFPYLSNLSIYLVALFDTTAESTASHEPIYSLLELPAILPRLVPIVQTEGFCQYVLLEDLICSQLSQVVVGFPIRSVFQIRATRNFDYNLLENEVVDLLKSVHREINKKWEQEVVRLEVSAGIPDDLLAIFRKALTLDPEDIYRIDGPLDIGGLSPISRLNRAELRDPPFNPRLPHRLTESSDIFAVIAEGDLLVRHPYDSFYAVTRFLYAAATDPDVLAIKQTLYRTSGDSPIIEALLTAAENGKQVVAVIELKARFDERANIVWARRLERAGVNVVFGFVGYKTHVKSVLVVRREKGRLVRYTHLATGNYNSTTARLYTDMGILTCDPEITEDVATMFNFLTGYNILAGERRLVRSRFPTEFNALVLAPFSIRDRFIELIDAEIECHSKDKGGRIIAKMNALTDKLIIDKLYLASQAGVKISLVVRGMCCLVPGVQGLSDNIEVISIIDRFLEHSRIYYFHAGGEDTVLLSSADWMPRNFDRRIEVLWPLRSKELKQQFVEEIMPLFLADNQKSWLLQADGSYQRKTDQGEEPIRAQQHFIEWARAEGVKSVPYEKAIRQRGGGAPVATQIKRPKGKRSKRRE